MLQKKYSSKNSLAANFQKNGVFTFPCGPKNDQVTGIFAFFGVFGVIFFSRRVNLISIKGGGPAISIKP